MRGTQDEKIIGIFNDGCYGLQHDVSWLRRREKGS